MATSAADFLPSRLNLLALRRASKVCEGCELYKNATQTVFGAGPASAVAVFVGEQPGDVEDIQGEPFVGPAGKLFDKLLAEAGIDRQAVYVTNAVKHFKWKPRGKRRMHAKPGLREIAACRPWLQAELEVVQPPVLVCLGATAAQSLLGKTFKLTQQRGQPLATDWAAWTMATYHPSALLRAYDLPGGDAMYDAFVSDLHLVAEQIQHQLSTR